MPHSKEVTAAKQEPSVFTKEVLRIMAREVDGARNPASFSGHYCPTSTQVKICMDEKPRRGHELRYASELWDVLHVDKVEQLRGLPGGIKGPSPIPKAASLFELCDVPKGRKTAPPKEKTYSRAGESFTEGTGVSEQARLLTHNQSIEAQKAALVAAGRTAAPLRRLRRAPTPVDQISDAVFNRPPTNYRINSPFSETLISNKSVLGDFTSNEHSGPNFSKSVTQRVFYVNTAPLLLPTAVVVPIATLPAQATTTQSTFRPHSSLEGNTLPKVLRADTQHNMRKSTFDVDVVVNKMARMEEFREKKAGRRVWEDMNAPYSNWKNIY